jgi:uncharacterized protein (TIGR02246 family)
MNLRRFAAIAALLFGLAASSSLDAAAPRPAEGDAHPRSSQISKGTAQDTAELLSLTEQWVRSWNEKDVDRMRQLQADDLLYGVFGSFTEGPVLIEQLRSNNFWGVTYSLRTVDPKVRILSSDIALVLFALVGTSAGPKGAQPYRSLFTLVYQRRDGEWKIVHVHDSDSGGID